MAFKRQQQLILRNTNSASDALLPNSPATLLLEVKCKEGVDANLANGFSYAPKLLPSSSLLQSSHQKSQGLLERGSLSDLHSVGVWNLISMTMPLVRIELPKQNYH